MKIPIQRVLFHIVTLILTCTLLEGSIFNMKTDRINLPKTIDSWTRPDSPRVVNSQNIFDYMDGAGELYVGYRFDHLKVYEYKSDSQHDILVELYYMKTSDDAFGLISLDWDGEPLFLGETAQNGKSQYSSQSIRALYGEGLLRIWSDDLYARVMAYRETSKSRDAVISLGEIIASNRKTPAEPDLLKALSPRVGSDWRLQRNRVSFFRSYLVLNSIYYISPKNILDLDHSAEAVTAPYENIAKGRPTQRSQFLLLKYKDPPKAKQALIHFHETFLSEYQYKTGKDPSIQKPSVFNVEDGWLGYQLNGKYLLIVFDCPDEISAETIIHQNASNLSNLEG